MSGIAGLLHRDGRSPDIGTLERMLAAAPHRGRDGCSIRACGAVALAHQRLTTTVEAAMDTQPLSDARGRVLVFDGRIDECDGTRVGNGWPTSDAARVLLAWDVWGERCVSRLAGDFAFALWDHDRHLLFCARDPLGIQPFYYADCGSVFVLGSELGQVLAHPAVDKTLDEGFAAELLAGEVRSDTATLYRGVRRLPPAHVLVVDRRGHHIDKYWDVDLSREVRYRNDDEYAEHFKALFEEAVRCRLRSTRKVAAYLSGGLDSSSVVVVAADLARRGLAPAIEAVSFVFPGRPEADESFYIQDVIRVARVPWIRVEPTPFDVAASRVAAARRRDIPEFPNDVADAVRSALVARNVGVTLSGAGGDLGLSGSYYFYADLLRRGRLVALARRYVDVARSPGLGWTSAMFLRGGVWPLLPPVLKGTVRRLVRPWRGQAVPSWIVPGFARRTALAERLASAPTPDRLPSVARYDIVQSYRSAWGPLLNGMFERASAEAGIEDRHPFYDVRLVEFVASLPDEQRWQRGQTKYVLRRALEGLLPESVRARRDKAEFSCLFVEALDAIGGETFFRELSLAGRGWIEPREVLALHSRMRKRLDAGDLEYGDDAWKLWMIAGLETWLRSNEEGADGAAGQAA